MGRSIICPVDGAVPRVVLREEFNQIPNPARSVSGRIRIDPRGGFSLDPWLLA